MLDYERSLEISTDMGIRMIDPDWPLWQYFVLGYFKNKNIIPNEVLLRWLG